MTHPVVLIADDEEAITFSLAREVRRQGLTPLVAGDGSRAVVLAESAGRNLVGAILDVRMPGLDGVTAALAIRATQPHIPLALMTAFGDWEPTTLDDALVLRKPFDLERFTEWLARVLREGQQPYGGPPPQAGAA